MGLMHTVCQAPANDVNPPPPPPTMFVSTDEKTAIARRYLEPQSRADSGVPEEAVDVADDAMDTLIQEYCRCERSGL